jgi:hypothetical protein
VEILSAQRGRVRACTLILAENPNRTFQISPDPEATEAQRQAFGAWTGQPFPAPARKAVR